MYEDTAHAKFFKHNCYQGITRSLVRQSILALEYNNVKLSCKNEDEMKRFLKRGKCGNRGKSGTTKCWSDWIDKLNRAKQIEDTTKRVPLLCW